MLSHFHFLLYTTQLNTTTVQQCWYRFGATLKTQTLDQMDYERLGRDVACRSEQPHLCKHQLEFKT